MHATRKKIFKSFQKFSSAVRGALRGVHDNTTRNTICQLASALMRADRRESLRATMFLCTTFCPTPRISTGCAALNASAAACLFPLAIAVSTFFRYVLIRDSRARLTTARRSAWRAFLLARARL
jgi:hypothetical protein